MKGTSWILLYCATFAACMVTSFGISLSNVSANSNPLFCVPKYTKQTCPCPSATGVSAVASLWFPPTGYALIVFPTVAPGILILIRCTSVIGFAIIFEEIIAYVINSAFILSVFGCPVIQPFTSPGTVSGTGLTTTLLQKIGLTLETPYAGACTLFPGQKNYNGKGARVAMKAMQSFMKITLYDNDTDFTVIAKQYPNVRATPVPGGVLVSDNRNGPVSSCSVQGVATGVVGGVSGTALATAASAGPCSLATLIITGGFAKTPVNFNLFMKILLFAPVDIKAVFLLIGFIVKTIFNYAFEDINYVC